MALFMARFDAGAANVTAASASYNDVLTAVTAANAGDTVLVPATVSSGLNWTQEMLINKSITLSGAGTTPPNITRINNQIPWDGVSNTCIFRIAFTSAQGDKPVRITGFYCDNINVPVYNHSGGYSWPDKSGVRVECLASNDYNDNYINNAHLSQVRIDHCFFNKGKDAVALYGYVYGVVDHNSFSNCDIGVGAWGDDNASWARPIVPGTSNAMFIENNTFVVDNNADWTPVDHQVYHQEGARTVIRYNTFDLSKFTLDSGYFIDSHGNQNYFTPVHWDFRGQPIIEIYENTLMGNSAYQSMELRGGANLVWSNSMTTVDGSSATIELWEEEAWQSSFFSPLRTSTEWPAEDQINSTFIWGNTWNGGAANISAGNPRIASSNEAGLIVLGRDYWLSPPNSSTKTTYPSTSPSPSSAYSVPYQPITSYTPFVYPHPLVSGQVRPAPPVNLHVVLPAN